jgi:AcrR family transcriptional regulator
MKSKILKAALWCARRYGLYKMSRQQIAKRAHVSTGAVSFHYGSMEGVRDAVIQHSIDGRGAYLDVLAEALGRRDARAAQAPAELKREALDTLA